MTLKITVPVTLGPAQLHATDVPEADYPAYAAGTTYALGARVISANAVWESAQAGNIGHDPATSGDAWWLRVSATNRWKAFSLEQVAWTTKATSFYYEFDPGAISAVHIIGLRDATSVRVRMTDPVAGVVFDSNTRSVGRVLTESSWWAWCFGTRRVVDQIHFYDLPTYSAARLRIDFAGGANLGVQAVLAGKVTSFGGPQPGGQGGGIQYGARLGIDSYSRVVRDQWGAVTLKKGYYSKRMSFTLTIPQGALDRLVDFLVESDARVQLWNISDRWRATQALGFVKSWEPTINTYRYIDVNIEIEGVAANA